MRSLKLLAFICCLLLASPVLAAGTENPALDSYNPPFLQELYRLRINNSANGSIEASFDGGFSWALLGHVLYPTTKVSPGGFAAAKLIESGRVAATAVNAIHVKTGAINKDKTIFSLLPWEMLLPATAYRSFYSSTSSIYTDIHAGTAIFGGGLAPFVGNQVFLSRNGQPLELLPNNYVPKIDDSLEIVVDRPLPLPKQIVFENRFGGSITLTTASGASRVIGQVLRPVCGIGRFEGGVYASPGRIRANHPGVIDISLAPHGSVGGFQIVPSVHGQSLDYVKTKTQWLVVGPASLKEGAIDGLGPLFKYFIQPNYSADAIQTIEWEGKLLSRYLVQIKYDGQKEWQPAPIFSLDRERPLPVWADTALEKVGYIRILFPVE